MSRSLVSVIIPFYNAEAYIEETINSVLSQTHSNVEVICVDDGSNDRSLEKVNQIRSKDQRVRLSTRNRLPKSGSTCRNIGISLANGEFVVFLDADDVLAVDCIEKRLSAIEGTNYCFVVFPMASFSESTDRWKMTSRLNVKNFEYFFASGFAAWQVTSPIWRKDFLANELKGFDESFQRLQDIELHLRAVVASEGNYLVMNNNKPDCFYRSTLSLGLRHNKMLATLAAYEKFTKLVEHIHNMGMLSLRHKFSGSILIMYLTMLTTVNLLYSEGVYDYKRNSIASIELWKYLTWYDKFIFYFTWLLRNPKLGSLVARGIRRICQYRFL